MAEWLAHLNWTAMWTAIGAIAALASVAVALVSILLVPAQRRAQTQRQHLLAFRGAVKEVGDNVQHLKGWEPRLEEHPSKRWEPAALTFTATNNLLVGVSIPLKLRYRIPSVVGNIGAYAIRLGDAVAKGGANEMRDARDWWYIIDLYLRQLARYLFAEMRRQKLGAPDDWTMNQPLGEPMAHHYAPQDDTAAKAAYNMEHGLTIAPNVPWAEEPDDPVYADCRLEVLIARARERHEQQRPTSPAEAGWEWHPRSG